MLSDITIIQGSSNVVRCHLEPSINIQTGTKVGVLLKGTPPNSPRAFNIVASVGIYQWSVLIGANNYMHFIPDDEYSPDFVRRLFIPGTTIDVDYYDTGKRVEDNLALTHVFGNSHSMSQKGGFPMVRMGDGARDYSVYTIIATPPAINEGDTYLYRQYFIMDSYMEMADNGAKWNPEALQDHYDLSKSPNGHTVKLFSSHKKVGAVVVITGDETCYNPRRKEHIDDPPVCIGSTTPTSGSKALFQITCGRSTYIGSNLYHFTPDGLDKKPYICSNDAAARGIWTLLGFFPEGSCSSIQDGYIYDKAFCQTDVPYPDDYPSAEPSIDHSISPTNSPSNSPIVPSSEPSLMPSTSPSTVPVEQPTSNPSFSPSSNPTITPTVKSSMTRSQQTTSKCSDSSVKWGSKQHKRDCSWVALSPIISCSFPGLAAICSNTCNDCSTCTDTTLRFYIERDAGRTTKKDCNWVARKNTQLRCKLDGVSHACRSTCGTC